MGEDMKTTRQTNIPHRIFRTLALLSASVISLSSHTIGAPAASRTLQKIPAFIEKNRHKKDVMLNEPQCDSAAKVYYLHYLNNIFSNEDFNRSTGYLAGLHNQMKGTGAELILYVNYTREDAARYQKARRFGSATNIPGRCRRLNVKCPIFNADKQSVRNALFRNHQSPYGETYTFAYPHLRAIDADGKVLAYFMMSGRSVRMIQPHSRFSRVVVRNVQNETEWISDAIQATHSFLIKAAESDRPED